MENYILESANYYDSENGLTIQRIISSYHGSNTYIIYKEPKDGVIVVDPGDPDISLLQKVLTSISGSILAVWLTHEHSDHCAGVNALYNWRKFDLFCSESCGHNIKNAKKNFSFYIDEINAFTVDTPNISLAHNQVLSFFSQKCTFYETPGHSEGSGCFLMDHVLFSGDTWMAEFKTPLNFPGSDKEAYKTSLDILSKCIKDHMVIFPGHGLPFRKKK